MGFKRGVKGSEGFRFGTLDDVSGRVEAMGPNGRTVQASLSSYFFSTRELREKELERSAALPKGLAMSGVRVVHDESAAHVQGLEDLATLSESVFSKDAAALPGAVVAGKPT
jgi:hypothetical protein